MIDKKFLDELLFQFLESIYLFEQKENSRFDITWHEVYALQLVKRIDLLTITRLAGHMAMPVFKLSRMLKGLERRGFIIIERDACDSRVKHIGLTKEGIEVLNDVEQYNYETISERINVLEKGEMDSITGGLMKLRQLLGVEGLPNQE